MPEPQKLASERQVRGEEMSVGNNCLLKTTAETSLSQKK